MSTTIDSRVVEMRFDNKHFESNVSTTMSTLDKLKQKLNFTGGTKGLENVGAAAKKVDMSGLGAGVDAVQAKFSAMQVVGVTALANITNSAVNAGKRIIKALTLDPITTGFSEYETQINATQTILANTQSKGTTIDDVNKALEELNTYADKTIYNFTEMTRNIGTFTAAGVDLDTSVNAIQGIANLAAISGSTSQQASTAMYQLSQALSSGTVKLMDWNSVVNAGMGGQVFQDALKETARVQGVAIDSLIEKHGSFRETLSEGWLTSEILTDTLQKFTLTTEGLTEEQIKANREMLKAKGYTEEQIDEIFKLGDTATNAATKVKTFTQLWDVLKEAAQSGWSKTWKLIIGDFEGAKNLLTPLADFLTGIVNKMSDWRNAIIESALGRGFKSISDSIQKVLKPALKVTDTIKETVKTIGNLGEIVDNVILGKFGNGIDRVNALTKAGVNYYEVQNKVNEKLGNSFRYSDKLVQNQNELLGDQSDTLTETTKKTDEQADATVELSEKEKDRLKGLLKMTEAELVAKGYTKEQIDALKELGDTADKLGIPIDEFIDNLDQINGRWLLINSFKNIGSGLINMFKAMGDAWKNIFPETSIENLSNALFNGIAAFHKFTSGLKGSEESADKFRRTFSGIFAALDIVLTVVGGPLKIAFKLLMQLLGAFGFDILDVTAFIGDMLVKLRDFIDGALDFTGVFEKIADPIKNAYKSFKEWIESLKESKNLPEDIAKGIASGFGKIFDAVKNFFKKIPEFFTNGFQGLKDSPLSGFIEKLKEGLGVAGETIAILGGMIRDKIKEFLSRSEFAGISADSIQGLIEGFKGGAARVWDAAVELVSNLVQKVKDFLGIHSPSTVFAAIGGFIIAGLIDGLQNGIPDSLGAIKDVFQPMLDWIKNIDFGAVFAGVIGIGTTFMGYKAVDAINKLASPFEGLGEVFEGTGKVLKKSARPIAKVIKNTAKVVKSFSKVLDSVAFSIKLDAVTELIRTLGETILMIAAAILILKFVEPKELWNAVGAIAVLSVVLIAMAVVMSKLNTTSASIGKEGLNIKGLSSGLSGIAMAILLIAATVKILGSLKPEEVEQGFTALLGIFVLLGTLIVVYGAVSKKSTKLSAVDLGSGLLKMATALLLMVAVVKLLGGMDRDQLVQGAIAMAAFGAIIVGLMAATRLISGSKNVDKIGGAMLAIAGALAIMAIVVRLMAEMSVGDIVKGALAITAFGGIVVGLMAATKLISGSKNIDKIGNTLLKIAVAIGVMALTVKLLAGMSTEDIVKGTLMITAFSGIIVGLMAATKLISGSKNITKIGGAIIGIAGAIAIMAFTAFMLSMVSWEGFAKGTIMVTAFGAIIVGLMAATKLVGKDADKISKTIITIAAAIAALGLVAVLLSLVPTDNLKKGLIVVTILSAVMAGLIAVTKFAKNCMGTLIALTAAIAVLTGALYLISTIPTESLVPSAIALGGLMLVMTGVLALLGVIGKMAKDAMMGALALAVLAVPLALFGLVLAMMSAMKVNEAIPNAMALSVLCTVLTALLIPLSLIGMLVSATGGMALMGVVALLAMAVPLAAFVGIIALMSGIQNGIANAMALADLMTVIGDVLFKISIVAPLAVIAVAAISGMIGLMTVLGVLATAIGALVTAFPELQTFLDTGIDLLVKLAGGIGRIMGSFITGFSREIMTILPELGLCLSQFMINAKPFIDGAKLVDEKVLAGVGILSGAVVALTAADLLAGISSFLQGGSSFADLGTQLSQFMINALPFIAASSLISPEAMTGVKTLADAILIITAADVLQGLTSFITGGQSLENFATQLPILGKGLADFSTSLGEFTDEQLSVVNCAAQAIKTLAQASSEIPNSGGLLAAIVGENDLGTFAEQFPVLGTGLAQFLVNIGTFTEEQVATVNCAAQAIKSLAQASSEIPNSGGLLAMIVGENDLGTFAEQFPILGSGLRGFLENIGTFTDAQVAIVDCAAQAIKSLAQASSEIPNSGGLLAQIVGENDLGTFAEQFPVLGNGLRGFLDNVGDFKKDQLNTIDAGANAVKTLASVANEIPNAGGCLAWLVGDNDLGTFAERFPKVGKGLRGFTDELGTFSPDKVATVNSAVNALSTISRLANANMSGAAKNISSFSDKLPGLGKDIAVFCSLIPSSTVMDAATSNIKKLLAAIDDIANANSGTLATFADNLKKVSEEAVKKFIGAFTSKTANATLKLAAMKLAKQAVDGLETQDDDAKDAGENLGKGYIKGINAKKQAAYDAGFALGKKAAQGINDGQDSASPSKLAAQSGRWLGEGYVIGIGKMGRQVDKAGYALGETATKSLSNSIARISDIISSDIDTQPTIRPILDLSDVRSGASALNGMLAMDSSVGVRANIGAISSMMSQHGQNGVNSDVVAAIDKLNKKMDNLGNTTYTINGVTYDDGSNINEAVATLVRAARIERRV